MQFSCSKQANVDHCKNIGAKKAESGEKLPSSVGDPLSWNREVVPPDDTTAHANRAACKYQRGSLPSETHGSGYPRSDEIPVKNIIIIVQENRSFDHYFQKLPEYGQPDVAVAPPDYLILIKKAKNICRTMIRSTVFCVLLISGSVLNIQLIMEKWMVL